MVGRPRPQAYVLHGCVGFGDDVHRVPMLSEGLDDLLGQMSLAGPRKACEQQALAVQAVAHRVLHSAPRRLRSEWLRFHARPVLLRDVLHHQTIGLDGFEVTPGTSARAWRIRATATYSAPMMKS